LKTKKGGRESLRETERDGRKRYTKRGGKEREKEFMKAEDREIH